MDHGASSKSHCPRTNSSMIYFRGALSLFVTNDSEAKRKSRVMDRVLIDGCFLVFVGTAAGRTKTNSNRAAGLVGGRWGVFFTRCPIVDAGILNRKYFSRIPEVIYIWRGQSHYWNFKLNHYLDTYNRVILYISP